MQHYLPDVVNVIVQMERYQLLPLADPGNGQGVADQVHRAVSVIGRGDQARLGGHIPQLLADFRLADDDAPDAQLHGILHHVRLVSADDNAVLAGKKQIFPGGGQRDGHVSGDAVHRLSGLVEQFSLDDRQQVVQRHLVDVGVPDRGHIIGSNVSGGQHSVQGPILIHHRDRGNFAALHQPPCPADGDAGIQNRRRIVLQIPDLCKHIVQKLRRLEVEPVQNGLGLIVHPAQTGGSILPVAQAVLQGRVRHGGYNGIRVRVSVACYIDGIHEMYSLLCFPCGTSPAYEKAGLHVLLCHHTDQKGWCQMVLCTFFRTFRYFFKEMRRGTTRDGAPRRR